MSGWRVAQTSELIGMNGERPDKRRRRSPESEEMEQFLAQLGNPPRAELTVIGNLREPANQMASYDYDIFLQARVVFEQAPDDAPEPRVKLRRRADGSAKGRVVIEKIVSRDAEQPVLFESLCGTTVRQLKAGDFVAVESRYSLFEASILRAPDMFEDPERSLVFFGSRLDAQSIAFISAARETYDGDEQDDDESATIEM